MDNWHHQVLLDLVSLLLNELFTYLDHFLSNATIHTCGQRSQWARSLRPMAPRWPGWASLFIL